MAGSHAAPRAARTIEAILATMGVEEYDERVTRQLLEFLYQYVWSVLDDARVYSDHAEKPVIDVDDVKLAIRSRVDTSFTQPPPREDTMRVARERNSEPLPPVDCYAGISLPHPDLQLTAQNVRIILPEKHRSDSARNDSHKPKPS